jgi:hypothetical protein
MPLAIQPPKRNYGNQGQLIYHGSKVEPGFDLKAKDTQYSQYSHNQSEKPVRSHAIHLEQEKNSMSTINRKMTDKDHDSFSHTKHSESSRIGELT